MSAVCEDGVVRGWTLPATVFGKDVAPILALKDSLIFCFSRLEDVTGKGGSQVLALIGDETKPRLYGFLGVHVE